MAGRSSDQSMQSFITSGRTTRSGSGSEIRQTDISLLPVVVIETLLFPHQFSKITFHKDDDNRADWMISVLDGTQKLAFLVNPKATWSHIAGVRTLLDKTDLYQVGMIASIKHVAENGDGKISLFVQAVAHARATAMYEHSDGLYAQLEPRTYREESAGEEVARLQELGSSVGFSMPSEMRDVRNPEKIVELLYSATDCASWIDREQSQALIECSSSTELVKKFHEILSHRLERLGVRQHIVHKAYEGLEKANRKYLLLQQLKAIREELGENKALSITEKLAALPLPEEVRVEVDRKLARLEGLMPESPETEVIQTYLDWIARLPWGKETVDNMSITHAKQVLDEDHYGLKDIKERILDFI
jgi:ATP-dependent Lon protease